jgi:uncharacterized protein (DUF1919 family)
MYNRKLNNEWYTGKWYNYNPDQDKTREEIKRLIEASTFVDDEDYDNDGVSEIPKEVRYKHYSDTKDTSTYGTTGQKRTRSHRIESSDEFIDFKKKDRFRLMEQTDDEKPYQIMLVEYNKNTYNSKAAVILPGLVKEYTSKAVMTLR